MDRRRAGLLTASRFRLGSAEQPGRARTGRGAGEVPDALQGVDRRRAGLPTASRFRLGSAEQPGRARAGRGAGEVPDALQGVDRRGAGPRRHRGPVQGGARGHSRGPAGAEEGAQRAGREEEVEGGQADVRRAQGRAQGAPLCTGWQLLRTCFPRLSAVLQSQSKLEWSAGLPRAENMSCMLGYIRVYSSSKPGTSTDPSH